MQLLLLLLTLTSMLTLMLIILTMTVHRGCPWGRKISMVIKSDLETAKHLLLNLLKYVPTEALSQIQGQVVWVSLTV